MRPSGRIIVGVPSIFSRSASRIVSSTASVLQVGAGSSFPAIGVVEQLLGFRADHGLALPVGGLVVRVPGVRHDEERHVRILRRRFLDLPVQLHAIGARRVGQDDHRLLRRLAPDPDGVPDRDGSDVHAVEVLVPQAGEVRHVGQADELPAEEVLQGIVEVERIGFPVPGDVHLPDAGERPRRDGDDVVRDLPEHLPRLFLRELVALRAIPGNPGLFPERRGGGGKEQGEKRGEDAGGQERFHAGSPCRGSLLFDER